MPSDDSSSAIYRPESWTSILPLTDLFPRSNPLEMDIGCGKGRFLCARAAANPEINYIGIDRMLSRLRKLERKLGRAGLDNARLLRVEASYVVRHLLPPGSVSAVYTLFPDPWPKRRHHRRRLFNQPFVDSLHRVLVPGGTVHVMTDHAPYADAIHDLLRADPRFEETTPLELGIEERTDFEEKFLKQSLPIRRLSFRTPLAPPPLV